MENKRLTIKTKRDVEFYITDDTKCMSNKYINKLGAIEDLLEKHNVPNLEYLERCIIDHDKYGELQEQLGYPLDRLLETNEIYVLDNDKLKKYKIIGLNFKEKQIYFWMDFCPMYLSFDEYKSLYWLKEDQSE